MFVSDNFSINVHFMILKSSEGKTFEVEEVLFQVDALAKLKKKLPDLEKEDHVGINSKMNRHSLVFKFCRSSA
ncbi:hypothetical protein L2E82_15584 [Cichorium intybus]|uniref:Uncharacterized protein n=1 Tax=Cichorium intybus TaxID=13427 RepID=A0ACB9F368_CICIN|nr:hypothetical protein L2E82_15584 [Cichorium intybus]